MEASFFFDSWATIQRTLVTGFLAYVSLVMILRTSGKRTLSKWNAFDFVVTIALGSSLATAVLSKNTAYAQVLAGFLLLVALQYVVTWLSVRSNLVRRAVKSQPTLLVYQGQYREEALKRHRVTHSEVRAALREQGASSLESVGALILETDGSFSLIATLNERSDSVLMDVEGYERAQRAAR